MSPFVNKSGGDEEEQDGGQSRGLEVDLDERVCSSCRRVVPAWVRRCPDCGGEAVHRSDLEPAEDALLRRFLEEDPEAGN